MFQKFKWDGDAWKTFIIYIVLVPGTLYYAFASEHQVGKERHRLALCPSPRSHLPRDAMVVGSPRS